MRTVRGGSIACAMTVSSEVVASAPKLLAMEAGSFYDCVMPEDVRALWGPIPMQRLPDGVENECKVVTHG